MDKNGMITISSEDWSNYPMVEKTENIPEIILYWKHSTVSSAVCTETTHFTRKGNRCRDSRAVTMVLFHYHNQSREDLSSYFDFI